MRFCTKRKKKADFLFLLLGISPLFGAWTIEKWQEMIGRGRMASWTNVVVIA